MQFYEQKQYDKAAAYFDNLYDKNPDAYFTYYYKCLVEIKEYNKAEKVLKKQSLRDVPAVLYRHDGSIHENKRPQRIRELDSIELPAFGRVDLTKYQGYNVLTSRGCPYKCTFCSVAPVWDHTAYFRNNESIIKEMEILHETTGKTNVFWYLLLKPNTMQDVGDVEQKKGIGC